MKYIVLAFAFCFAASAASAQEVYSSSGKTLAQVKREREKKAKPHGYDPSRVVYGGGFGLGIGSVTNVGVSPIVGYRFTDKFTAGIGIGYQYLKAKDVTVVIDPVTAGQVTKPWVANSYYPSAWFRYSFGRKIFAHVEYQHNFMSVKYYTNDFTQYPSPIISKTDRVNEPSVWIGAGLKQPMTDRISMVFMALYNVLPDKYGIYSGPIDFRIGINVGF